MNINQVITILHKEISGPSYCVNRLSESLASIGHNVNIFSIGDNSEEIENDVTRTAFKKNAIPFSSKLMKSSAMKNFMFENSAEVDIIHSHGLWRFPNIYAADASKLNKKTKHVISPIGMLSQDALKYSAVQKKVFWNLFQKQAVLQADCLHATSEKEYHEIREFGLKHPVAVIPNGIDFPEHKAAIKEKKVVFLGRLHPIKSLDFLVKAWQNIQNLFPNWRLEIVGPDDGGYISVLKELIDKDDSICLLPPVSGNEKTHLLSSAGLLVLPSASENFGMVVAESLAVGTPVIATHGTPWQGLSENNCGWWIPHGITPLANTFKEALSVSDEKRQEMGMAGAQWMMKEFNWLEIAQNMAATYTWAINKQNRPEYICID